MPGTATVTAPIGPGLTATALVMSNIRSIEFDTERALVNVKLNDGRVVTYDAAATTTITATASSGTFTFTVSE